MARAWGRSALICIAALGVLIAGAALSLQLQLKLLVSDLKIRDHVSTSP